MATVTPLHQPQSQRYPRIEDPRLCVTILKEGQAVKVVLSAYNEFGRLSRLGNVALRLPLTALKKLHELHDHKGDLSVVWNTLPTGKDVAAVQRAWEAECEFTTSHFINGRPLLDNCVGCPPPTGGNILRGTPVDPPRPDDDPFGDVPT